MNLKESTDGDPRDIFFANFSHDCTALSVGSKKVFRLYSLEKGDELDFIHGIVADDVRIIERTFESYLVAVVTFSAPRDLSILNIVKEHEVSRRSFPNTILAVKLNKMSDVICLEQRLYVYINSKRVGNQVERIMIYTPPNPLGLCILSQNTLNNFVAYPGSSSKGKVEIYDISNSCSMGMIAAHENPLAAMTFNATATMIATASDMGNVIRVFDVIEKTKLYEFRRGVPRCARIYSLCFSQDSNYLSSSSNTETVHIFRLDNRREKTSAEEPQGLISYLKNMMVGLLTQGRTAPTSMLYDDRAFATVRLPFSGIRNICGMAWIQGFLRVLIVSGQSILYIYNVDIYNGGECVLERTYNLSVSGCSMPVQPLRLIRVEGLAHYQEAPADTHPAEE